MSYDIAYFAASSGGVRLTEDDAFWEYAAPTAQGQVLTKTVWVGNLGTTNVPAGAMITPAGPLHVPASATNPYRWRNNLVMNIFRQAGVLFSVSGGAFVFGWARLPLLVAGGTRISVTVQITTPQFDLEPESTGTPDGFGNRLYDYGGAAVADYMPWRLTLASYIGARFIRIDSFEHWGNTPLISPGPAILASFNKYNDLFYTGTSSSYRTFLTAGKGRDGGRALYVDSARYVGSDYEWGTETLYQRFAPERDWENPPGLTQGFWLNLGAAGSWTDAGVYLVINFAETGGVTGDSYALTTGPSGKLRVRHIYTIGATFHNDLVAETAAPMSSGPAVPAYVEFGVDNGTSTASYEVRVDRVTVLSGTVARQIGSKPFLNWVLTGAVNDYSSDVPGPGVYVDLAMDDYYLAEICGPLSTAFAGPSIVAALRPNGSGAYSEFPEIEPAISVRYATVDDPMDPFGTDWVGIRSTDVIDHSRELFTFQPAPPAMFRIYAAQLLELGDLHPADDHLAVGIWPSSPFLRGNANELTSDIMTQTTDLPSNYHTMCMTINPLNGLPWDVASLNALQAGERINGQNTGGGTSKAKIIDQVVLEVIGPVGTVVAPTGVQVFLID